MSAGWSRAALSGSTWRSSASRGSMPSCSNRASSSRRTAPPAWPLAKPWPRMRASIHSPVPPTRMGSFPRARISSTAAVARAAYSAALHCSVGSATAIMWWGMPCISSSVGAAVPTVMPRYICMESTDTTSPLNFWASRTPRVVFPQAVGPATQTIFGAIGTLLPVFTAFWPNFRPGRRPPPGSLRRYRGWRPVPRQTHSRIEECRTWRPAAASGSPLRCPPAPHRRRW